MKVLLITWLFGESFIDCKSIVLDVYRRHIACAAGVARTRTSVDCCGGPRASPATTSVTIAPTSRAISKYFTNNNSTIIVRNNSTILNKSHKSIKCCHIASIIRRSNMCEKFFSLEGTNFRITHSFTWYYYISNILYLISIGVGKKCILIYTFFLIQYGRQYSALRDTHPYNYTTKSFTFPKDYWFFFRHA